MLHYADAELSDPKKMAAVAAGFLLGLLLLELAVGGIYAQRAPLVYEDCYRLSESATTLDAFIAHIRAQHQAGVKTLVILGGSTSYAPAGEHFDTPACFLQKKLKNVRVYNLAVDANRPTDDYLTFQSVKDAADYIVLNGYYGWFGFPSTSGNGKDYIAHPEFTALRGVVDADSASMLASPHSERKSEYFFDSLANAFSLYRNRALIQQEWFGNSPEEKPRQILRWVQCGVFKRCALARYQSFVDKDAETKAAILEAPEFRLAALHGVDEVPLKYWVSMAQQARGKMLFYLNPINPALTGLEQSNYSKNVLTAQQILAAQGAPLIDLGRSVSALTPSDFTDASHTLTSGNEKIAQALYSELIRTFPTLQSAQTADASQGNAP